MRGEEAGRSDHRAAIPLVQHFCNEAVAAEAWRPTNVKGKPLVSSNGLQRLAPGAINDAIVGDRIADPP